MNIEDYDCQFCGKKAKQFVFAAFCCDDNECVERAFSERGGPGGHKKRKTHGATILLNPEEHGLTKK